MPRRSSSASNASAVALASPRTACWIGIWYPSFGASISTCATTAPGAISLPFLVVHCVKLAPNPRMKSLSAIRSSATGEENPPLMPTDQGFFENGP